MRFNFQDIRQLAKEGTVPVVWAGRKALINLDDVLELMRLGTARPTEEAAPAVGGIRRILPSRSKAFEMVIAAIAMKSAHTSQLLFL